MGEYEMYHKKKIALFISHVYGEYQSNLSQGVIQQAMDYGYCTEVYATNDGENLGDYGIGEESILKIPNFEDFDGVVFASDTYLDPAMKENVCALLQKHPNCPVIEITEYQPSFPCICLENNLTAGILTEHLLNVHNCKRICYLGSLSERFFSDRRQKAYELALAQQGLFPGEYDIYLCRETEDDYTQAVSFFNDPADASCDAVVCYNDRVAIGFWLAAYRAGYKIPRDFAIVGCDNSIDGQNIDPPLTTVTFPTYQVGCAAVTSLMEHMQGKGEPAKTVFAEPVYAGSCGCSYHNDTPSFIYSQTLTRRIAELEKSAFLSMQMSAAFSHVTDIDDGMDLLAQYVREMHPFQAFYLCLYSNWDSLSSHILELTHTAGTDTADNDTMLLKLAIRGGKRLAECSFSKVSLLPDFITKDSAASYVISPLFFEDRAFGYLALSFADNRLDYPFYLVHWIKNITQLLQNICESKRAKVLTQHLEEIYMKDVLTGLYNHHGYQHYEEELLASCAPGEQISALLFDLDELKTINDHFGHKEGDFALRGIGQALRSAARADDICSRFSGDEFYCLIKRENAEEVKEFVKRVEQYLANYNSLSDKPYNISVSTGYATAACSASTSAEDVRALFAAADSQMYDIKKNKVKHVLRG